MDSNYNRDRLMFTSLIYFTGHDGRVTAAFANVEEARIWAARNGNDFVHFSYGSQLAAFFAMKESRVWWEQRLIEGVGKLRRALGIADEDKAPHTGPP